MKILYRHFQLTVQCVLIKVLFTLFDLGVINGDVHSYYL